MQQETYFGMFVSYIKNLVSKVILNLYMEQNKQVKDNDEINKKPTLMDDEIIYILKYSYFILKKENTTDFQIKEAIKKVNEMNLNIWKQSHSLNNLIINFDPIAVLKGKRRPSYMEKKDVKQKENIVIFKSQLKRSRNFKKALKNEKNESSREETIVEMLKKRKERKISFTQQITEIPEEKLINFINQQKIYLDNIRKRNFFKEAIKRIKEQDIKFSRNYPQTQNYDFKDQSIKNFYLPTIKDPNFLKVEELIRKFNNLEIQSNKKDEENNDKFQRLSNQSNDSFDSFVFKEPNQIFKPTMSAPTKSINLGTQKKEENKSISSNNVLNEISNATNLDKDQKELSLFQVNSAENYQNNLKNIKLFLQKIKNQNNNNEDDQSIENNESNESSEINNKNNNSNQSSENNNQRNVMKVFNPFKPLNSNGRQI